MSDLAERRKLEVAAAMRRALYDAIARVMAEGRLSQVSMQRVAEVAGVSRRTLYNYFQSRDDLVAFALQNAFDEFFARIVGIREGEGPADDKLRALLVDFLTTSEDKQSMLLTIREATLVSDDMRHRCNGLVDQLVEVLGGILQQGIDEGLFRPLEVDGYARIIIASADGIAWRRAESPEDAPALTRELALFDALILNGIARRPECVS